MQKTFCTYIMTSQPRGTLYIGATSDIMARIYQHRNGVFEGYTSRHKAHRLVYIEFFGDMTAAIAREKQLKNRHRQWKINLIEQDNPHWNDLAVAYGFDPLPQK